MNKKIILPLVLLVLVVAIGGYFLLNNQNQPISQSPYAPVTTPTTTNGGAPPVTTPTTTNGGTPPVTTPTPPGKTPPPVTTPPSGGGIAGNAFFGMHILMRLTDYGSSEFATTPIGAIRLWDDGTKWGAVNPAQGSYRFGGIDMQLAFAKQNHLQVLYTFGHAPQWATGGADTAPPLNYQSWTDYVTAIATHAKGQIQYYELWNEPNAKNFWTGSQANLVTMAQLARTAIKAADPNAQLLSPAPANGDVAWLDGFFAAGGGAYIDGVDFHGRSRANAPEDIVGTMTSLRTIMAKYGISNLPIRDTEYGWRPNELPNSDDQVAAVGRDQLLRASLGFAQVYWYAWDNAAWGTLWSNGTTLPAGVAYGQVNSWISGATLSAPCSAAGTVWTCGFTRSGGYQSFAVWNTAGNSSYTPGSQFTMYKDLAGNTTAIGGGSVTIGKKPILLEN